jgi:hypothetical protein
MTKTGFRSGTQTPFSTELERLVSGTGLTQQAFMDELSSQLGEVLTLSRFNGWIRGRYAPPPALQDRVLLAARAVAAEAARYPRPIPDVPAEVVQAKLAEWQKTLTLKQISVITGLPFITLNSWRVGKHRRVRYSKWQQALRLMDLWLESSAEIASTMREAQVFLRGRAVVKDSDPEPTAGENRISGILSLSRRPQHPSAGKP